MLTTITLLVTSLAISQISASIPPSPTKPAVREQPFGELLSPPSQTKATDSEAETPAQIIPDIRPAQIADAATPPEMIARAMEPLENDPLPGQGISLAEALSFAGTPQKQLEVTHAYWRLAAAVASHNIQCRHVRLFDITAAPPADQALLKTAQQSAAAAIEEARCAALAAQHDLAQAAMLPPGQNLPLPADLPHVGTYHTHFTEIFAAKTPPPALSLIDNLLPIYCKAIDARGQAVIAAQQAFAAALNDYHGGRTGIDVVVARAASLLRQQTALVNSVCDYNHEIVEYAVASLAQPVGGAALVAMLIKTLNNPSGEFGAQAEISTATRPDRNQPTLAPPREAVRRLGYDAPATDGALQTVPQNSTPPSNPLRGKANGVPASNNPMRIYEQDEPSMQEPFHFEPGGEPARQLTPIDVPPEESSNDSVINNRPVVPVQAKPQSLSAPGSQTPNSNSQPAPRSVGKPPLDLQSARENSELPADVPARPLALADYLEMNRGGERRAMIETYWLARQRAGEYQALARQARLLDEIGLALGANSTAPRLQAMRLATEAEMFDARIRLLQTRYGLADLAGQAAASAWPIPVTAPRATVYEAAFYSVPVQPDAAQPLRSGFAPTSLTAAESWPLRRLRAMIPSLHETVRRRAAAAAEAETSRTAALAALEQTDKSHAAATTDRAIDCTTRQTEETMLLMTSLSRYNNAVARHALTVLPPAVSGRVLADVLLN